MLLKKDYEVTKRKSQTYCWKEIVKYAAEII